MALRGIYILILLLEPASELHSLLFLSEQVVTFPHLVLECVSHLDEFLPGYGINHCLTCAHGSWRDLLVGLVNRFCIAF